MEGSACDGGHHLLDSHATSLTAMTQPSLDELARLWALVGGPSSGSKEAAATLGPGLRGALRSSRGKPRPGAAAVLQLLDRLLSPDDTERDPGEPTDHATARVVDAIGWELFDGLVVHLPVSRRPSPRSHALSLQPPSRATRTRQQLTPCCCARRSNLRCRGKECGWKSSWHGRALRACCGTAVCVCVCVSVSVSVCARARVCVPHFPLYHPFAHTEMRSPRGEQVVEPSCGSWRRSQASGAMSAGGRRRGPCGCAHAPSDQPPQQAVRMRRKTLRRRGQCRRTNTGGRGSCCAPLAYRSPCHS